eukprot:Nk52_evm7s442 gene=Nk52_evmTU7s442
MSARGSKSRRIEEQEGKEEVWEESGAGKVTGMGNEDGSGDEDDDRAQVMLLIDQERLEETQSDVSDGLDGEYVKGGSSRGGDASSVVSGGNASEAVEAEVGISNFSAKSTWVRSNENCCTFEYKGHKVCVVYLAPSERISMIGSVGLHLLEGAVDIEGFCYHKALAVSDSSRIVEINGSAHSAFTSITAFDGARERRGARLAQYKRQTGNPEGNPEVKKYYKWDRLFVDCNLQCLWGDKKTERVRKLYVDSKSKGALVVFIEHFHPMFKSMELSGFWKSIMGMKYEIGFAESELGNNTETPLFEDVGLSNMRVAALCVRGMRRNYFTHEWRTAVEKAVYQNPIANVLLVCGPKNCGKSTFCRYLVNSLLCPSVMYWKQDYSLDVSGCVAFLECDLGQSEFTPPGYISLSLLTSPITGPSFSHLRRPIYQLFVGDTSPKSDPEFYLLCIAKALAAFSDLKKEHPNLTNIPLVINTQGWVKGIGFHLLSDIIAMAKPNNVIEIISTKEDEAEEMLGNSGEVLTNEIIQLLVGANAGYFDATKEILSDQSLFEKRKVNCCEFKTISSVSLAAEGMVKKENASDNRSLSLVSYFQSQIKTDVGIQDSYTFEFSPFMEQIPFEFEFSKVALMLNSDSLSDLSDGLLRNILKVFDGTLVCLAYESSLDEKLKSSTNEVSSLPIVLKETRMPFEAIGSAFIRCIDPHKQLYYVLSPEPEERLRQANVFVKFAGIEAPSSLTACSLATSTPYQTTQFSSIQSGGVRKNRRNLQRKKNG